MDNSQFQFADLSGAQLRGISLQNADFSNSNIKGADFREADIRGCAFRHVEFDAEGTFGFIFQKPWTRFGGEYQEAKYLANDSDPVIQKYISDETSKWSLLQRHRLLGQLWYILSNLGRSPARLFLWAAVIWLFFGSLYAGFPLPSILSKTPLGDILIWLAPKMIWSSNESRPSHWFEPFYFSTVTLTTLGYGDIHPAPGDWKGQLYVCAEAILGFVILGAFVSLLIQNSSG